MKDVNSKQSDLIDIKLIAPVLPYARVVPNGVEERAGDRILKVSVIFTPDELPETARSGFALQTWPKDIVAAVHQGFSCEHGAATAPWTLPLHFVPALYVKDAAGCYCRPVPQTDRPPVCVTAYARRLQNAWRAPGHDLDMAADIWRKSLDPDDVADPRHFHTLSSTIAASLSSLTATPGALSKLPSDSDSHYKAPQFGRAGQIVQTVSRSGDRTVDTVLTVPQADMAVALEFQRVEELLCGLAAVGSAPDARRKAETQRLTELEASSGGKTFKEEERRSATDKAQLETELAQARTKEHERLFDAMSDERKKARQLYRDARARRESSVCDSIDRSEGWQDRPLFASGADGRSALDSGIDVQTYASWPQYADDGNQLHVDKPVGEPEAKSQMQAAQAFFTFQSTPTIARMFGLVVDVEVDLTEVLTKLSNYAVEGEHCTLAEGEAGEGFVFVTTPLACNVAQKAGVALQRALPWSLAKLRNGTRPHFWPATEAELWLGPDQCCVAENVSQFEGHIVMGAKSKVDASGRGVPRFDLTSMDVRTATELEAQRRQNRRANVEDARSSKRDAADAYWSGLAEAATLQTAGLTLLDRGLRQQAVEKLAARYFKAERWSGESSCGMALLPATPGCPAGHVVLDADDLTMGMRLDVGVPVDEDGRRYTAWRALCSRVIRFGTSGDRLAGDLLRRRLNALTGGFTDDFRVAIDSAMEVVPSRLLPTGEGSVVEAAMEEAVALWDGAPLGVDCADPPVEFASYDVFSFGRTLDMPRQNGNVADDLLPVSLRYSRPYRFKMRAVYQGGMSVDVADSHDADRRLCGRLFYPTHDEGTHRPYFRFLRQHRISPPTILMDEREATRRLLPMPYVSSAKIVVRTVSKEASPDVRKRAVPRRSNRIIVPPHIVFDDVIRYGVFDVKGSNSRRPIGALSNKMVDSEGAFPVTVTHLERGFSSEPYVGRRTVHFPPRAQERDPRVEYGGPVLKSGSRADGGRYYPDPSAEYLALALRVRGRRTYLSLGADEEPVLVKVGTAGDYPHISPIKLDVRADPALAGRRRPTLGQVMRVVGASTRVRIDLAPGEEFDLDMWCIPSAKTLAKDFSLVQSLAIYASQHIQPGPVCGGQDCLSGLVSLIDKAFSENMEACVSRVVAQSVQTACETCYVGPGGMIAPPTKVLLAIAEVLHDVMKRWPLGEIAAVRSVPVIHATDRPTVAPFLSETAVSDPDAPTPAPGADALTILRPSAERLRSAEYEGLANDPLRLDQNATGFVLDGVLTLPLDVVDGFELKASSVLPGSSNFDDRERRRSLAKKRAGLWPTFRTEAGEERHYTATDIFGFDLDPDGTVTHRTQNFTLLRVENLAPSEGEPDGATGDRIDLRQFFLSSGSGDGWRRTILHEFPDGKARRLVVTPRALSRNADEMETARYVSGGRFVEAERLPVSESFTEGFAREVILPATVRPATCDARSPLQAFRWEVNPGGPTDRHVVARHGIIRLRFGREWFSSGECERLGVVVWPPQLRSGDDTALDLDRIPLPGANGVSRHYLDLYDFIDDDLGPGGRFITRMGEDPIRGPNMTFATQLHPDRRKRRRHVDSERNPPGVFLPLEIFRDLRQRDGAHPHASYEANVLMPIDENDNPAAPVPPSQMMSVGLVHYEPRFDPEREEWFVDVDLDPGLLTEPFVRFGLVRYQPHTRRDLQVSRPVVQWAQVMPWRRVEAAMKGDRVEVTVTGPASRDAKPVWTDGENGARRAREVEFAVPHMRFHLFRERRGDGELRLREALHLGDPEISKKLSGVGLRGEAQGLITHWQLEFDVPRDWDGEGALTLFMDEIDWRRPAAYPVEPLSEVVLKDADLDLFVESGTRFTARLNLSDILPIRSMQEGGKPESLNSGRFGC